MDNPRNTIKWSCDLPFCAYENFNVLNPCNPRLWKSKRQNWVKQVRQYLREQGLTDYMRRLGYLSTREAFPGRLTVIWTRRTEARNPDWPKMKYSAGYFPNGDHGIQPLVTFPNLCKFMTLLHEVCNNPEGEFPRVK